MINDSACLDTLEDLIDLLVTSYKVVFPDVVTNGVVNAGCVVLLEFLGISVGKDELERCAVLDCSEKCVINVTFHVDRRSCKFNVAVKNYSEERNGCAGACVTAGVGCCVGDVVNVLPGIYVTAGGKNLAVLLIKILERIGSKALGVFAVVRLILVEVGGEVRTESRYCDAHRIVLEVVLGKLGVEAVEVCGGHCKLEITYVSLSCRTVLTLTCITVINSSDRVLLERKSVEELVVSAEYKVEIGINSVSLCLCISEKLFKLELLLYRLIPIEIVRYSLIFETALGVSRKNEVDVLYALCRQLIVHLLYIAEGSKRDLSIIGDREELLGRYRASEGLDVKRNVFLDISLGKLGKHAVSYEVVTVCLCHSHVGGIVILSNPCLFCYLILSKHNVSELEIACILSGRYNGPGRKSGNRDSIRKVIGIGRSGSDLHTNRIVESGVVGDQLCQCVTLFDDRKEASILSSSVFHRLSLGYTEYGVTNYLIVRCACSEVIVCVVVAVNCAVEVGIGSLQCKLLSVEQRTCSVGEEGVAGVGVERCSHIRKDLNVLKTERAFIEADTVCRKSYGKAVLAASLVGLLNSVLKSYSEECLCLIGRLILKLKVSVIEVLVGVVGAVCLDDLLDRSVLSLRTARKGVDRSMLDHRIFLQPVILDDFTLLSCGVIKIVKLKEIAKLIVFKGRTTVFCCLLKDLLLKVRLGNSLRNEVSRVNTSDRVVNSYTVLDRLYEQLAGERIFFLTDNYCVSKAVVVAFLLIVRNIDIVDKDLREEFALFGNLKILRRCGYGVCEKLLAGRLANDCYLSAISVNVDLVSVFIYTEVHGCKLFFFCVNNHQLAGLGVGPLTGLIVHSCGGIACVVSVLCSALCRVFCINEEGKCAHQHQSS